MPFLVDGHNLIPHLPGASLADLDDEQHLLELLQDFCRARRQQVEVFFDGAPPGQARRRGYGGLLQAHFVPKGGTADEAIRKRLAALGKQARNWSVVTSDRVVQNEARAAHARVVGADEFARLLLSTLDQARSSPTPGPAAAMSENELNYWLDLFNEKKKPR